MVFLQVLCLLILLPGRLDSQIWIVLKLYREKSKIKLKKILQRETLDSDFSFPKYKDSYEVLTACNAITVLNGEKLSSEAGSFVQSRKAVFCFACKLFSTKDKPVKGVF